MTHIMTLGSLNTGNYRVVATALHGYILEYRGLLFLELLF